MTRARPSRRPRGLAGVTDWLSVRHPLRVEAALVLGVYALYETTRGGVAASRAIAIRHARDVVAIERSLHLFVERAVQQEAEHVSGLIGTLGVAYLTFHLAFTSLVLLWLHRRRPDAYPLIRTTLLIASTLAVVGYALFPTAPPRLSGLGISDTITSYGHVNLNKGLVSGLYNPYAAVPSMHAAYALVVGFALFRHGRHLLTRLAGGAYPAFVVFVIVATGNHFFFDVAAGALVAAVASAGAFLLRRPAGTIQALPLTAPTAELAINRRAA
jgi:hypothetical protein